MLLLNEANTETWAWILASRLNDALASQDHKYYLLLITSILVMPFLTMSVLD